MECCGLSSGYGVGAGVMSAPWTPATRQTASVGPLSAPGQPPQPESARSARRLAACSGVAAGGGREDDGSEADRALAGLMGPTVTRGTAHIWRPAAYRTVALTRRLTGALSPGLNEDRMPYASRCRWGRSAGPEPPPRAPGVLASHDPGPDRPGPLGVVHPRCRNWLGARTRSGGAGRVLHEGGALLEEGRVYFG